MIKSLLTLLKPKLRSC